MRTRFLVLCTVVLPILTSCSGGGSKVIADGGAEAGSAGILLPDAQGCRTGGSVTAPTDSPDPSCTTGLPTVSFAKDVVPVLASCTGEICHAPWKYETLAGQHSTSCCDHRWLVDPAHPSASHVIQAVRGVGACVPQMPLDQGSLADADITKLTVWVCQGALDN